MQPHLVAIEPLRTARHGVVHENQDVSPKSANNGPETEPTELPASIGKDPAAAVDLNAVAACHTCFSASVRASRSRRRIARG